MSNYGQRPELPISDDGMVLPLNNTTNFYVDKAGDAECVVKLLRLAAEGTQWTISIQAPKRVLSGVFSAITATTVLSDDIRIVVYCGEWPTILIEELVSLYRLNQNVNQGSRLPVIQGSIKDEDD